MENKILAAMFQSRNTWERIHGHINEQELSPEGALIYGNISEYYETDHGSTSCDVDILCSRVTRANLSDKVIPILVAIIKSFPDADLSHENIVKEVLNFKAYNVGNRVAGMLASGRAGHEVEDLMTQYLDLSNATSFEEEELEEEYVDTSPSQLIKDSFSKDALIQLYPLAMNNQLDGGAKPGHHILVFAPTEMGKTLMVVNMNAGFLRQGLPVLYIGNEDPAADVLMRHINRLTGMTKHEVLENVGKAESILAKRNWDKFKLVSLAPGTFYRIEQLVQKYQPKVVVLDQLRNIDVQSENRTQALEKAATLARNLAKRHNVLVVSVTQAADSASGKTILTSGDVDSSNVGIPGQCDLMIGIGADAAMKEEGFRMLSFPKNKLSGVHTPIPVKFNPALSKVEE